MIRFVRWLLGLCTHRFVLISAKEVPWQAGDDESFIVLDLARAGKMRCTRYIRMCECCGVFKVSEIPTGKRK